MTASLSSSADTKALVPFTEQNPERVVLLIDVSGSMSGSMPAAVQTRIAAVTESILVILAQSSCKLTRYGLTTFDSMPRVVVPITDDYLMIEAKAYMQTQGGTDMDTGLSAAVQQEPNRIIMLSDGGATCGDERVLEVARTAATLGIKIDTIGIGEANDTLLQEISRITGGRWVHPTSPKELAMSFAKLETKARFAISDQRVVLA